MLIKMSGVFKDDNDCSYGKISFLFVKLVFSFDFVNGVGLMLDWVVFVWVLVRNNV